MDRIITNSFYVDFSAYKNTTVIDYPIESIIGIKRIKELSLKENLSSYGLMTLHKILNSKAKHEVDCVDRAKIYFTELVSTIMELTSLLKHCDRYYKKYRNIEHNKNSKNFSYYAHFRSIDKWADLKNDPHWFYPVAPCYTTPDTGIFGNRHFTSDVRKNEFTNTISLCMLDYDLEDFYYKYPSYCRFYDLDPFSHFKFERYKEITASHYFDRIFAKYSYKRLLLCRYYKRYLPGYINQLKKCFYDFIKSGNIRVKIKRESNVKKVS